MKTAGIICEYNPFHYGHAYQIEQTRARGATHIVAVMSGHFVQRGDIAITDKWARAQAALHGGADLVVELPCAYALSSAEFFARGAVHILSALGCEMLSFGSESGDITALTHAAAIAERVQSDPALQKRLLQSMEAGQPYPAALSALAAELGGDGAGVLASPNDILGVEYLKAIRALGANMEPAAIARVGAGHDAKQAAGAFASASHIRGLLAAGGEASAFTPMRIAPADIALLPRLEAAILYRLRGMSAAELASVPDVAHGLEHRICEAARQAGSLQALQSLIKTKRYPMARIRRILLCALLGITKKDLQILPPYARILGMNTRGLELLAKRKGSAAIPVSHSLARLEKISPQARRFARLEAYAGDVYALAFSPARACGLDYTTQAVIRK